MMNDDVAYDDEVLLEYFTKKKLYTDIDTFHV